MNQKKALASISPVHDALKSYRESIGKLTDRHHYINETRLIQFAISGRNQRINNIKVITRQKRKLYERVIRMNCHLISEGINYQQRKQVCRQLVENHKARTST